MGLFRWKSNEEKQEVVEAVCMMPVMFKSLGNISMIDLLVQSGYRSSPGSVTAARIRRHLRAHPELLDPWLFHSEDQRCSPAWFLAEPGNPSGNESSWAVGLMTENAEVISLKRFSNRTAATAHYIMRQAENLSQPVDGFTPSDEPGHKPRSSSP